MIKRIKIEGYKSFKNLDITLQPLTVIFGPNASGKSNFLDAVYLLSKLVSQKNIKEAFDKHRGLPLESFCYGNESYEKLLKKTTISFTFEVDVELSESVIQQVERMVEAKRKGIDTPVGEKKIITEPLLRYRLSVEALPSTGYLRVMDERLCAIKKNGEEKRRTAFLEKQGKRISLRMEGQAHPMFHEIGLDHTIVSTALYEPHYPHITAFRMELANWYTYYLEPRALMREDVPLADIDILGPRGENLAAFLNTLKNKHPKDYQVFNLTLGEILPADIRIEIEHLKEGLVGLRLCENGSKFSARLASEGTLRLIGLLAAIHPKNPATTIAFEEPENGVHPVRLKIISDILKNAAEEYKKQIIVTTHSPVLPDYFQDKNLFICRKDEVQTTIVPFSSLNEGPLYRKANIEHALEDRILRGDYGG